MRILMLTQRLPYAPDRGDRLRAYHMLRRLRDFAEIDLVSLVHDDEEASHAVGMQSWLHHVTALRVQPLRSYANAALSLPTSTPLTHAMLDAPGMKAALKSIVDQRPPDVVFAYCSSMAKFAMQPPLDRFPLVLDFVDVDSQKWRDLAAASHLPMSLVYRREAATLGAFEAQAAARASTALVVNEREAQLARQLSPGANVQVVPNGVEVERLRPTGPPSKTPRVVFCGVMNYAPNAEGMTWFVREVWPLVLTSRPDAKLAVVGHSPSEVFRAMCAEDASITVTGSVPDVRDWLWESAVGIAPLQVARGVQNKALEAIAAGLPIVITEAVAGGLPPQAASASRVANTARRFAQHVVDLLGRSPMDRRRIAESADFRSLTWAKTLDRLEPIFERAATPQRAAHDPWVHSHVTNSISEGV